MMMMASRGKGEVSSSYFLAEEDGSVNNDPGLQPMIVRFLLFLLYFKRLDWPSKKNESCEILRSTRIHFHFPILLVQGHSLLAINETCPEDDDYLEDSPEMMASSSRKRPREDEVGNEGLLRSPIMRWDPRDNLPAKVKEGLKDIIDETAAASTLVTCPLSRASYSYSSSSSSSSSSTVTTATKRDPEERLNRAIHRYWQKLIDQFDNGPTLREVMDIISRYADQTLSIKETFSKVLCLSWGLWPEETESMLLFVPPPSLQTAVGSCISEIRVRGAVRGARTATATARRAQGIPF